MNAIPRYRPFVGPALFSAGFRPFFLGGAIWAAIAIPAWLVVYRGVLLAPTVLPPAIWHAHEMVYGYGMAIVAGFLLTAIPNWTGRMPLQGWPLIGLVAAWAAGRAAVLFSGFIGATPAAVVDLIFPLAFTIAVIREIIAGRNWHNLGVITGLIVLGFGNLLVHLEAIGIAATAELGDRIGIAMLLMLISIIGGRIVPSFTTNWLRKVKPAKALPTPRGHLDTLLLMIVIVSIARWAFVPEGMLTSTGTIVGGLTVAIRLSRWRGLATLSEPLVFILHVGYGWLAVGLILVGVSGFAGFMPPAAALHSLTVGSIGTMTLAVMTRASLGHTGQQLAANPSTMVIYVLITLATLLRISLPALGTFADHALWLAGISWTVAFALFVLAYGKLLVRPRA